MRAVALLAAALFLCLIKILIEDAKEMSINIYQAINILSFSKYSGRQLS
jgi:hypothetical protein